MPETIEMLIDIRDRVIRIETKMESLPELEKTVRRHGEDLLKARTSINLFKWLGGVLFITVPAGVMAYVRAFKG